MNKEKRITKLITEIRSKRMTVNVKNVVIHSIMSKGDPLTLSQDEELIQSIINKPQKL